jgi:putative addiction module CopG family antidote
MTIHLKPETEALIQAEVERGAYRSAEEFVEQAVRMLHEEEELWADEKQLIHEKIERAFGEFERGQYLSGEESLAARRERKAALLAESHAEQRRG